MWPPIEPNREDCCNSGCSPCIFEVYEKQLKLYEKFLQSSENGLEVFEGNGISQLEYTSFVVIDKINLCNSHIMLTLAKQNRDSKPLMWKPGQHFLIKYNNKSKGCTRAYTPIKLKNMTGFDFSIIVKIYENGVVSNYISNLNKGDETLWRGPYGKYEITENKFSRIFMLAQGTGIAPFITIIEKILDNEDDMTRIILLYCCQSIQAILYRDELYNFKSYWNFSYELFISKTNEDVICKYYNEPIKKHRLNYDVIDQFTPVPHQDQFLLCGSEQFMEDYKLCLLERSVPTAEIVLF